MLNRFTLTDFAIIAAYFCIVLSIGLLASRKNKGADDFITGNRTMPWLAVLGSLIATEVSAATFLATPGTGFSQNMNYLQMGIGSILARIFIAFAFIGTFYAANTLTIYAYLEKRFGNRTRVTASIFFIITRVLASAVRLMIAATGISLILDLPYGVCLIGFTLIALTYTGAGGIRGIIWTDVLQAIVFISCGVAVMAFIANSIGWSTIIEHGAANGRFEIFKFKPDNTEALSWINDSHLIYVAILFGFISTTAAFGTDQDLTQRMLTCKNVRDARKSILLSGFISLPIVILFLFIGVALFGYFQVNGTELLPTQTSNVGVTSIAADKVFPWFIGNELPSGLRGLLLVGVLAAAMSSLDSAVGALGSSALVDLYRPLRKQQPAISENSELWLSRAWVLFFGILLVAGAWWLRHAQDFLWLSFKIGSITYGALLGIFLLGIFTKRGSDDRNCFAMFSAAILCSALLWAIETERLPLGWTWLVLIGTAWTFLFGLSSQKQKTP